MRPLFFSMFRFSARAVAAALPLIALTARGEDAKPAATATPAIDPAAVASVGAKAGGDLGTTMWQTVCAQCHGAQGEGKLELKSPSIAHLPSWYVTQQISNFREGRRGTDPAEPNGILMSAIAKALQPEQIQAIAKHVEKMPMVAPTPAVAQNEVDLENGMLLFQERCMECHRYNASGEMAFGSPPLTGRQDWYLAEQIRRFKSGKRGTIKGDVNGAKMVISSQFIGDEQSLKDVMGYIMTLNAAAIEEQEQQQKADSLFKSPADGEKKVTEADKKLEAAAEVDAVKR